MKYKVPFIKPNMPDTKNLSAMYDTIIKKNWFSNFGAHEQELSKRLAKYVGNKASATTVNNATTGLMLAIRVLMAAKPNATKRKVLIPSFTFAAGSESLIWCGLEPVFIDIDEESWQPDINQAHRYIERNRNKIAGILFCNIFGVGAKNIEEWEILANKFNLPLVIDSAAGFGSRYVDNSPLGLKGDCEVFSFHATKPLSVGEGGAICTASAYLANRIRKLQNFGFSQDREVVDVGLNGKMQEINAAIGLFQLNKLDSEIKSRQENLTWYKNILERKGFLFQPNSEQSSVCFASVLAPTIRDAEKLSYELQKGGVEIRRYYSPPLHRHKAFAIYERATDLSVTDSFCSRMLSLPTHSFIGDKEKHLIASVIST